MCSITLPKKPERWYDYNNENIIKHPFISNNEIVDRRKRQSGGFSWAWISFGRNLGWISNQEKFYGELYSTQRGASGELVEGGSRGMCRVPSECIGVGFQTLKHVWSLDIKSETFPQPWLCQTPVPQKGMLHCHWSSSFIIGLRAGYIKTSRETPTNTQPGFYFNNCN